VVLCRRSFLIPRLSIPKIYSLGVSSGQKINGEAEFPYSVSHVRLPSHCGLCRKGNWQSNHISFLLSGLQDKLKVILGLGRKGNM